MAKRTNYYDDTEDQEDKSEAIGKGKDSSGRSGILPKALLMGKTFEVGDEVVLKITALRDDEVVVEYASGESKAEEETEESSESPPETETEESEMAEEEAPAEAGESLYG